MTRRACVLVALALAVSCAAPRAQVVVRSAEYFLGPDPGLGQGTPIALTPGADVEAAFTLDTAPLPAGPHRISVRARDSRGAWSPVGHYVFVKQAVSGPGSEVVTTVEYYVGADPGLGQATPVSITPGADVEASFVLDTGALPPGPHRISARARDSRGAWSPVGNYVFVKQAVSGGGNDVVTSAEYFVDQDPGLGQATPIPLTPGADVEASFVLDTAPLAPGPHRISVRARDSRGAWSPVGNYVFVKQGAGGGGGTGVIAAVEYYVGADPGLGQATPVPVTPGADVEASFVLDTGALPPGPHRISVRARDGRGAWSPVGHYVFVKQGAGTSNLAVDRVEYFFDADPGTGNGTAVPLTPGPDLDLSFVADVSALSPGTHTVSVRARSTDGAWSLVAGPTTFSTGPSTAYRWTGATGDGLWTTAANWSPTGVPGPADDVRHNGNGEPPMILNAAATVRSFTLNDDAVFSGTGSLTVTGGFEWSGNARIEGSGTITAGPGSAIVPDALVLAGRRLVVTSSLSVVTDGVRGDALTLQNGGQIEVASGGVVAVESAPGTFVVGRVGSAVGGLVRVAPGGTFRQVSGASRISGTLDVDGLLDVVAGEVGVDGGQSPTTIAAADIGGTLRVADGAALVCHGGASIVRTGARVEGGGVVRVALETGGNLQLLSPSSFAPTLDVQSGNLWVGDGTGATAIQGALIVRPAGSLLHVLGGPPGPAQGSRLTVGGTVTLAGGLNLSRLGSYLPDVGARYSLLTTSARTGEFAGVGDAWPDRQFVPVYTPTEVAVVVGGVGGGGPVAGTCAPATARAVLDASDVRAGLSNAGVIGFDTEAYTVPAGSASATLYAGDLWVGGTVGGEVRTAAATYGNIAGTSGNYEFWPGPLDAGAALPSPTCRSTNANGREAWDRIYRVSAADVRAFEAGGAAPADLQDWPVGLGAPAIDAGGQPVVPTSRDQLVDLAAGQRPVVYGSQTAFWVMNDVGNTHGTTGSAPLGVEVRVSAFALAAPATPALDQGTFYRYTVVNRGPAAIQNAHVAFFGDVDLGDAQDDYVGTDPGRGLGFGYNSANADVQYASAPPAVGFDLLSGAGSGGYAENLEGVPTADPVGAGAYYNRMRGLWNDGSPVTASGNGYQTNGPPTLWAFPGDPEGRSYWSEVNTDNNGTTSLVSDRRNVVATAPFALQPGEARTVDVGVLFAAGTSHLNSVTALKAASDLVQARYDDGSLFATVYPAGTVAAAPVGPVTAGAGAPITFAVEGFVPTAGTLFYRPGGAPAYAETPLAVVDGTWSATIPAAAVTPRGVDYYAVLTDGVNTATVPASSPVARPAHLRVGVSEAVAAVSPPSDASYRMASVPVALDDPALLAVLGRAYGPYVADGSQWRALRWLPREGRYADVASDVVAATPGTAFWVATRAEAPLGVAAGQSVDGSAPFPVPLAPGWNQVGSPFDFPVAWAPPSGVGAALPYGVVDEAGGLDYLDAVDVLEPWAGYFVFNGTGTDVAVAVAPVEAPAGRPVAKRAAGYRLRLRASVPGTRLRDTQNRVEFADGARVGADSLDVPELPPAGAGVRLSVVEGDAALSHSASPDHGEGAAWDVEVAAAGALFRGGAVAVRVDLEDEGARPDGYVVAVLDLDRRTALPVTDGVIDLSLRAGEPARRLRVVVGTTALAARASEGIDLAPPRFGLGDPFPNPTRGGATVSFVLAERGPADLEVFDVLGRRIAVLAEGERDAGHHTVRWEEARNVAPGVYLYRLRAGESTATRRLTVVH